jgi:LysM repeat protein
MTKLSTAYSYTIVVTLALLAGACSTAPTVDSDGNKAIKQAPVAPPNDRLHVVKKGDSLYKIALKYTSDAKNWKTIAELNNISDPNTIRKGQVIVIPHALTRVKASPPARKLSSKPEPADKNPRDKKAQTKKEQPQVTVPPGPGGQTAKPPKIVISTIPGQKQTGGWLIIRGTNYPREINISPDTASDILTQAWPGTRMQYVDRSDGWYKVITDKGHGYLNPEYATVYP